MNKKLVLGISVIVLIAIVIITIIIVNSGNNIIKKIDDKIEIKNIYNINDAIVEEIEITLNEKTNIMKLTYTYDETSNKNLTGEFKGTILYETYFVDKSLFSESNIRESFNENNFKVIKGTDKQSYLVVHSGEEYNPSIYIYNDELELISKNSINDDYYTLGGKNINDNYDYFKIKNQNFNIITKADDLSMYCDDYGYCRNIVKIEDNKIYYLALKFNGMYKTLDEYKEAKDYGIVEERIYEIEDNKLKYEVKKVYNVTEMDYLS